MANRRYTSQFSYSFEKQIVKLMGSFAQTDLGAFAALVSGGITYTARRMGSDGNSITIAIVGGGTAGSEVVSVSGSAISIQIESGVSTRTQVVTALGLSAEADALISASAVSGGTAASLLSATPLAGGDDTDFDESSPLAGMTLFQSGVGLYEIQLQDSFKALIGCSIMLQRSSSVDLAAQLKSSDVSSAKLIEFRMIAGSTNTSMANGDILYIELSLRNE